MTAKVYVTRSGNASIMLSGYHKGAEEERRPETGGSRPYPRAP